MIVTVDGDNIIVQIIEEVYTTAIGPAPTFENEAHTHPIGDIVSLQDELDGKSDTSHQHLISHVDGLQNELDGKQPVGEYADAIHGHNILDVTDLQEILDGKQPAGDYAAADHGHIIDDITGLQDELDGKQPVGSYASNVHGHIITDVTGLQDELNKGYKNPQWNILNAIGSPMVCCSFGLTRSQITTSVSLVDGQMRLGAIYVFEARTYTGITFLQVTQGNFTGADTNGLAINTYSAGVMTVVAQTANSENIWKNVGQSFVSVPFTSPVALSVGVHYAYFLYNHNGTQATAPAVGVFPAMFVTAVNDYTNSAKMAGIITAQSTFPSPQAMSGVTANTVPMFFELY